MCVTTSVVLSGLLPLVALAGRPLVLFPVLILIGAFDGLTDVAMNSQAIDAQRARSRPIMTRFHGMWSVGAVTGGLISARTAAPRHLADRPTPGDVGGAGRGDPGDPGVADPHHRPAASDHHRDRGTLRRRRRRRVVARARGAGDVRSLQAGLPAARPRRDGRGADRGAAQRLGDAHVDRPLPPGRWTGRPRLRGHRRRHGGRPLRWRPGDASVRSRGHPARRTRSSPRSVVVATTATSAWPMSGVGLFAAGLGISVLFPLMFAAAEEMTPGTTHGMAAFSTGGPRRLPRGVAARGRARRRVERRRRRTADLGHRRPDGRRVSSLRPAAQRRRAGQPSPGHPVTPLRYRSSRRHLPRPPTAAGRPLPAEEPTCHPIPTPPATAGAPHATSTCSVSPPC